MPHNNSTWARSWGYKVGVRYIMNFRSVNGPEKASTPQGTIACTGQTKAITLRQRPSYMSDEWLRSCKTMHTTCIQKFDGRVINQERGTCSGPSSMVGEARCDPPRRGCETLCIKYYGRSLVCRLLHLAFSLGTTNFLKRSYVSLEVLWDDTDIMTRGSTRNTRYGIDGLSRPDRRPTYNRYVLSLSWCDTTIVCSKAWSAKVVWVILTFASCFPIFDSTVSSWICFSEAGCAILINKFKWSRESR